MFGGRAVCDGAPDRSELVTPDFHKTSIQIDRRVLIGFMAVMFVMNAVLLFIPWKEIMAGKNDFPVFYSNATMVREGRAAGLYDFTEENSFVRRVSDVTRPPNNHLPYELLLFVPLTYVSFDTAYILWTVLSLGMLVGTAILLRSFYDGRSGFPIVLLTILGFFPVWYCLLQGQDSILLLFLFALSFWFWRRGNDDMAGFVIALGLFRPQIAVPFVLIVLLAGKWKFIRGFVPGAIIAVLLSVWVVGLNGMADYVHILLSQGTQRSARVLSDQWTVRPGLMATWRGFLWVCLPEWIPTNVRSLLLLVGTFTGLAYAARKMYNPKDLDAFNVAFATSVATILLVSFHSFLNDFSLMILPLLIYAPVVAHPRSVGKKKAYWMVTLGFLFFLTPLYLLLLSQDSLGWFFLVELSALWLASHWRTVISVEPQNNMQTDRATSLEFT
jgi:hypothetical protein